MSNASERESANVPADMEALARKYTVPLRSYFRRRILEQADVDDLVQEVFLRLTRHGLDGVTYLQGYLFETAANVLRDRLRHRITHHADHHQPIHESFAQDTAFTPERVLLGKEALERLTVALQQLPHRTRTVFVLSRFEEMTHPAIADRLGMSLSSVEKHLRKALTYLLERAKGEL